MPDKETISDDKKLNAEWNSSRNHPISATDVTLGSSKKFWWKCSKGHEWQAVVKNRSSGSDCPYCSNRLACPDNDLAHNFPDVANQWHGLKNKDFTPEDVTYGSSKKVWWECELGHEWQATVTSRTKKNASGCPFCSGNQLTEENSLQAKYPKIAQEWHPQKNEKLVPSKISFGSNQRVWWVCKQGHEWQATVGNRVGNNSGCPYCSSKKASSTNNFAQSFPNLISEWDFELNIDKTPEDFTPKSKKKIWWKCVNGHSWEATIQSRANGSGCPNCSNQSSKPEMRILAELRYLFPDVKTRQKVDGDEIDVYLPSLKIGVEFDGSFYHRGKEKKDKQKNQRLLSKGINVIRVRPHPLEKLSEVDIVTQSEELTKNDLDDLLRSIIELSKLTLSASIEKYLGCKGFVDDETYRTYISYFPNPLPESSLSTTNPEISEEWDFTKNAPLRPENFTSGSAQKVWWICREKHSYETTIVSRTTGHGCPFCSGNSVHHENSLASMDDALVAEFDIEKNAPNTPSDFTIGSTKKVWWKCAKGHSWQAVVGNRTKSSNPTGCPFCGRKKASPEYNLKMLFPEITKEWNQSKNGNLRPEEILPGSGKKVWWKCENGHQWETTVARRTGENPTGCPVCYKLRLEQQKSEILVSSDIHEPLTRGKSVKCIETGEIFSSASAAERVMRARGKSVSGSKVLMCCKGERNSSGGYHWEWG